MVDFSHDEEENAPIPASPPTQSPATEIASTMATCTAVAAHAGNVSSYRQKKPPSLTVKIPTAAAAAPECDNVDDHGKLMKSITPPKIDTFDDSEFDVQGGTACLKDVAPPSADASSAAFVDILLVSSVESDAATIWVEYLISCFRSNASSTNSDGASPSSEYDVPPNFIIKNTKIEDIGFTSMEDDDKSAATAIELRNKLPEANLQMLVICPVFVQQMRKIMATGAGDTFSNLINVDKMIALMIGVDHHHNKQLVSIFPNFDRWKKMNVIDQDTTFVGEFLNMALDILSNDRAIQEDEPRDSNRSIAAAQLEFSIVPKKLTTSRNDVLVFFRDPIEEEDTVTIVIRRNMTKIKEIREGFHWRNKYTLQFIMPNCFFRTSALVEICVDVNGRIIGEQTVKCECEFEELQILLKSIEKPIECLCQIFNVPTTKARRIEKDVSRLSADGLQKDISSVGKQISLTTGGEINGFFSFLAATTVTPPVNRPPIGSAPCAHYSHYMQPKPVEETYLVPPPARPVEKSFLFGGGGLSGRPPVEDQSPSSPKQTEVTTPVSTSFNTDSGGDATALHSAPIRSSFSGGGDGDGCYLRQSRAPFHHSKSVNSLMSNYDVPLPCNKTFGDAHCIRVQNTLDRRNCPASNTNTGVVASSSYSANSVDNLETQFESVTSEEECAKVVHDQRNPEYSTDEADQSTTERWRQRNEMQQYLCSKQEQRNRLIKEYAKLHRETKLEKKKLTLFCSLGQIFQRKKKAKRSTNQLPENKNNVDVISNNCPIMQNHEDHVNTRRIHVNQNKTCENLETYNSKKIMRTRSSSNKNIPDSNSRRTGDEISTTAARNCENLIEVDGRAADERQLQTSPKRRQENNRVLGRTISCPQIYHNIPNIPKRISLSLSSKIKSSATTASQTALFDYVEHSNAKSPSPPSSIHFNSSFLLNKFLFDDNSVNKSDRSLNFQF